jgi:hypothetical protein
MNFKRRFVMECFICESNYRVIKLAGKSLTNMGWHIASRFNICEGCLAKATKLNPGECCGIEEEIQIMQETVSDPWF